MTVEADKEQIQMIIMSLQIEDGFESGVSFESIKEKLIQKGITEEDLVETTSMQFITSSGHLAKLISGADKSWKVDVLDDEAGEKLIINSSLYPDVSIITPEEQISLFTLFLCG